MLLNTLFRSSKSRLAGAPRPAIRLSLEVLGDRVVPSIFTVGNLTDSGAGSLRQAALDANVRPGTDLIAFAPAARDGAIILTSGQLSITDDLTIDGPGANKLTVNGNDASRIFRVVGGADAGTAINVSLSGLTITHGRADDSGGGIFNSGFSALTLAGVVMSNNVVIGLAGPNAAGGAVHSFGAGSRLSVVDSRIVGNTADGRNVFRGVVGGLAVQGGSLNVGNSTIADNQALGGAVFAAGGGSRLFLVTATVTDSVIRDNRAIGGSDGGQAFGGGLLVIRKLSASSLMWRGWLDFTTRHERVQVSPPDSVSWAACVTLVHSP